MLNWSVGKHFIQLAMMLFSFDCSNFWMNIKIKSIYKLCWPFTWMKHSCSFLKLVLVSSVYVIDYNFVWKLFHTVTVFCFIFEDIRYGSSTREIRSWEICCIANNFNMLYTSCCQFNLNFLETRMNSYQPIFLMLFLIYFLCLMNTIIMFSPIVVILFFHSYFRCLIHYTTSSLRTSYVFLIPSLLFLFINLYPVRFALSVIFRYSQRFYSM